MITIATGKYERPTYEVICSVCGEMYTQKRKPIENPKCKKCQKKYHTKKYYEAHKGKFKVDPNIKKERDKNTTKNIRIQYHKNIRNTMRRTKNTF